MIEYLNYILSEEIFSGHNFLAGFSLYYRKGADSKFDKFRVKLTSFARKFLAMGVGNKLSTVADFVLHSFYYIFFHNWQPLFIIGGSQV